MHAWSTLSRHPVGFRVGRRRKTYNNYNKNNVANDNDNDDNDDDNNNNNNNSGGGKPTRLVRVQLTYPNTGLEGTTDDFYSILCCFSED